MRHYVKHSRRSMQCILKISDINVSGHFWNRRVFTISNSMSSCRYQIFVDAYKSYQRSKCPEKKNLCWQNLKCLIPKYYILFLTDNLVVKTQNANPSSGDEYNANFVILPRSDFSLRRKYNMPRLE